MISRPISKILVVWGFAFLSLAILSLAALLGAGFADPPRAAFVVETQTFAPPMGKKFTVFSSQKTLSPRPFTLILQGHSALPWGLWLQAETGYLMLGLSLEGSYSYVTARLCPEVTSRFESCPALTEATQGILTHWKESFFLQPGQKNEIYLHYEPPVLVLRLNREWMWDLPYHAPPVVEWGRWQLADMEDFYLEARSD